MSNFGSLKNMKFLEEEEDDQERFFKRPRARQFFYNGGLVREREERRPTFHELFLDLVFVVIISKLGERLSEDATWNGVQEYILLFAPIWRYPHTSVPF